jgi:hypothetical protein
MGLVERGPMDLQKLTDLAAAGHVLPSDRVRSNGQTEWTVAQTIPGLFSTNLGSYHGVAPSALAKRARVELAPPTTSGSVPQPTKLPAPFPAPPPVVHKITLPMMMEATEVSHESASQHPNNVLETDLKATQGISEAQPDRIESRPPERATAMMRPATDPSIRIPENESKHKLRRGQYKEPMFVRLLNRRNVLAAICLCAAWLLYLLWRPGPPSVSDFTFSLRELEGYSLVLNSQWSQKPTMEIWAKALTSKKLPEKIDGVVQKVKKMESRHEIRQQLITAGESMMRAIKTDSSDDVSSHLEKAHRLLDLAEQELVASYKGGKRIRNLDPLEE